MRNTAGLRPRWGKGISGNPGGRPKGFSEVREACRQYAPEAVGRLVQLMRTAIDDRVRLAAALALLDRGFGKPEPAAAAPSGPQVTVNVPVLAAGRQMTPREVYQAMLDASAEDSVRLLEQLRPPVEASPAEESPQ